MDNRSAGTNPSGRWLSELCAAAWLTVLDNVELGLLPQAFSPDDRAGGAGRHRLIGLHGFRERRTRGDLGRHETARRLRPGARGEPELLMLDEPSPALDVLVADTLRAS